MEPELLPEIVDDNIYSLLDGYPVKENHFRKSTEKCKVHSFCNYDKMAPLKEVEARLPVPYPMGTSIGNQDFNKLYAGLNFQTRNLHDKKQNIKVVVTEEALDDWQAQCLNIPYEKYLRHKKMMELHNNQIQATNKKRGRSLKSAKPAPKGKTEHQKIMGEKEIQYNLQQMRGGRPNLPKKKNELIPQFQWRHKDVQSFSLALVEREDDSQFNSQKKLVDEKSLENQRKQEMIKSLERMKADPASMSSFTQNQRNLVRSLGGLPRKMLQNFRSSRIEKSNTQVDSSANPYQLPPDTLPKHSLNRNSTIDSKQDRTRYMRNNNGVAGISMRQSKKLDLSFNIKPASQQKIDLTASIQSINQSKIKQNFFVTDNASFHYATQQTQQTATNQTILSENEQNFYRMFQKKDAYHQTGQAFIEAKQDAIQQYVQTKCEDKESGKVLSENQVQAQKYQAILNQLVTDDELDLKNPFYNLESDKRIVKINKNPFIAQPDDNLRNRKLNFEDPEIWYVKGYDSFKRVDTTTAIDCFRQTVRLDQKHYLAMNNLGCCYEYQQRYDMAVSWFRNATIIKPDYDTAFYGLALSYLKGGHPEKALTAVKSAISVLPSSKVLFGEKKYLKYLHAVCLKLLSKFEESEAEYTSLLRQFNIAQGQRICKYIFGMVLLPLEQDRKKILEYVDVFDGIIETFEVDKNRQKLTPYYLDPNEKQAYAGQNKNPKWLDKNMAVVMQTIMSLSFFSRFQIKRQREIMEKINLKLYKANKLLFLEPNKVYVIISGSILMRSHSDDVGLPLTTAKFVQGEILNYHQNNNIFSSPETWYLCQVESEIAYFDLSFFELLWKDLMQNDKLVIKSVLGCHPMFKQLSDLTLMNLVYELFETRIYKKGDLITAQSKQSPTHKHYKYFYELRVSKLAQEIKKRKGNLAAKSAKKRKPSEVQTQVIQAVQPAKLNLNKQNLNIYSGITSSRDSERDSIDDEDAAEPKNFIMHLRAQQDGKVKSPPEELKVNDNQTMGFIQDDEEVEFQRDCDGFYLIEEGQCEIIQSQDNYCAQVLRRGEFFGESDLMKVIGYNYFGDIYAKSECVTCYFISNKNFQRIPVFEQIKFKDYCLSRQDISVLAYQSSERYKIDIGEYASYYGQQ